MVFKNINNEMDLARHADHLYTIYLIGTLTFPFGCYKLHGKLNTGQHSAGYCKTKKYKSNFLKLASKIEIFTFELS